MPDATDVITCRLPRPEAEAVRRFAEDKQLPVSTVIRKALSTNIDLR